MSTPWTFGWCFTNRTLNWSPYFPMRNPYRRMWECPLHSLLCLEWWKTWELKGLLLPSEPHSHSKDNDPVEAGICAGLHTFLKHFRTHYYNRSMQQPVVSNWEGRNHQELARDHTAGHWDNQGWNAGGWLSTSISSISSRSLNIYPVVTGSDFSLSMFRFAGQLAMLLTTYWFRKKNNTNSSLTSTYRYKNKCGTLYCFFMHVFPRWKDPVEEQFIHLLFLCTHNPPY